MEDLSRTVLDLDVKSLTPLLPLSEPKRLESVYLLTLPSRVSFRFYFSF